MSSGLANGVETLTQLFRARIRASGSRVMFALKGESFWQETTWSQFGSRVTPIAAGLVDLGVKKSDAVAILGSNGPEWALADMATLLAGASVVGVRRKLPVGEIQAILERTRAKVLFVDGEENFARVLPLLDAVGSLRHIVVWNHAPTPARGVHSIEELTFAGGTAFDHDPAIVRRRSKGVAPDDVAVRVCVEGRPVALSHRQIIAWLRATEGLFADSLSDEDGTISFLPMADIGEHVPGFFGRMNLGLRTAYASSAETVIDEIREVRPTHVAAPPRLFETLFERSREAVEGASATRQRLFAWAEALARKQARSGRGGPALSAPERAQYWLADALVYRQYRDLFGGRVRVFLTAGPLDADVLEFFTGVGLRILVVYGSAETCGIVCANTLQDNRLGTVGRPIPGVELRIEAGELLVRGPTVVPDDPPTGLDGWFRTGERAALDPDGFLVLSGPVEARPPG